MDVDLTATEAADVQVYLREMADEVEAVGRSEQDVTGTRH
jgi:hypothetical protein